MAHAHVQGLAVGLYGVDVFFVLSGYLITGVLLGTVAAGRQYRWFLGRRVARLMPALLVTLAVLAVWVVVVDVERGPACLALAATHAMDLPVLDARTCPGPLHITWSLAAEEQFYVVWPVLVLLLAQLTSRRAAQLCLGAYGALFVVSMLVPSDTAGWWNYAPPGRPSALLLGAALCFVAPLGTVRAARRSWLALPLFAAGLVVTGLLLALDHAPHQVLLGPVVAVPATVLIWVLVTTDAVALLRHRWLVWVGEISYCLYLTHVLALYVVRDLRDDDTWLTNLLGFAAGLAAAVLLHHLVETPLRTRGYAWLTERERRARSPQTV